MPKFVLAFLEDSDRLVNVNIDHIIWVDMVVHGDDNNILIMKLSSGEIVRSQFVNSEESIALYESLQATS